MLLSPNILAAMAGLVSCLLFMTAFARGSGMLFLFLPALPLFLIGFWIGKRALLLAMLAGLGISIVLNPLGASAVFLLFVLLPALLFTQQALLSRPAPETEDGYDWYPTGLALTHLVLYTCLLFLIMAMAYAGEDGGLQGLIAQHTESALEQMDGDLREAMQTLLTARGYAVFAAMGWIWTLLLYAVAAISNMILKEINKNIRPSLAVTPFTLPDFMLGLLVLCGVLSLFGSETLVFVGKTLLMTLLLPYFLYGLSVIHLASKAWPWRMVFLCMLYLVLLAQLWPALAIACYAIVQQCIGIGKRFGKT